MKKAERENKIKALWREVYGPPRFVVVGGPGILERLDKLEKAVEQEWRKRNDRIFAAESRLEARLEKLEGRTDSAEANIAGHERDLGRAGLILEGDKARQPEQWNKEHSCHTDCPCRTGGEPMADMPETGPSDRSLLAAEVDMMRDYRDEALDQRDKAWAERDQARAERDEWYEALIESEKEQERLRGGIERRIESFQSSGIPISPGHAVGSLRALLDGDDE